MEKIVSIPNGVNVEVDNFRVIVSGKNGKLEKDFVHPMFAGKIKIENKGETISVKSTTDKRKIKAEVGTIAAIVNSMIRGVTEGYTYTLKIVYMHFPFTVKVEGNKVTVANFLGGKAPRKAKISGDTKVVVKGDEIIVTGINREEVGQTCGNLERATKISSRDRRVFQDGIFLVSKGDAE